MGFVVSAVSKTPTKRKPEAAKVSKKSNEAKKSVPDFSKLNDNAKEVLLRFKKGCECHEHNCFEGKKLSLLLQLKLVDCGSQYPSWGKDSDISAL